MGWRPAQGHIGDPAVRGESVERVGLPVVHGDAVLWSVGRHRPIPPFPHHRLQHSDTGLGTQVLNPARSLTCQKQAADLGEPSLRCSHQIRGNRPGCTQWGPHKWNWQCFSSQRPESHRADWPHSPDPSVEEESPCKICVISIFISSMERKNLTVLD